MMMRIHTRVRGGSANYENDESVGKTDRLQPSAHARAPGLLLARAGVVFELTAVRQRGIPATS